MWNFEGRISSSSCGCKSLFRNTKALHVGPSVQETMGLNFSGRLWILGRKYMVCVDVPSARLGNLVYTG